MPRRIRDQEFGCLLPTHPHLASADFIRLLPVATFADLHIHSQSGIEIGRNFPQFWA